jgi:hypothetical protein
MGGTMDDQYSGNLRLRLPTDLHAQLSELATQVGVSLNTLMVTMLAEGVARRGRGQRGAPREVAEAMATAVLDASTMPTRKGQLIERLDAHAPEWRRYIPVERLTSAGKRG